MARLLVVSLLALTLLEAARKPVPPANARGENQDIVVNATVYTDRDAVKELIGSDLDGHYIVVSVTIEPKYGKEVSIERDDFVLRTDKDGEKTSPFVPSQIAGRGALVVRQTSSGGGMMGEQGGPIIGLPGTMGGPTRLPGSGGGFGGGADPGAADAKADNGTREKENPLVAALGQKMLAEKKTSDPLSGLLYFPMEKQKVKDLELTYGGRENRITMRFRPTAP